MTKVMTLAERHRRRLAAMHAALAILDDALAVYARDRGGRFVRYGSTAKGAERPDSDVDILADFPSERASLDACGFAEALCFEHALLPDVRPASWASEALRTRALAEGVVLR